MTDVFGSIEETGARAGDVVVCVKSHDTFRFRSGQEFTVIDFCGRPHVRGNSDRTSEPVWQIPWRGFGSQWRLVRRAAEAGK